MDEMLTLSRAARLARVSRSELQERIQRGLLPSFEGMVRSTDLFTVFPEARRSEAPELARMRAIKEAALTKAGPDDAPVITEHLLCTVKRLENELQDSRDQLESYQRLIDTLTDKLVEVQESCDQRQKVLLQAVISWVIRQVNERS